MLLILVGKWVLIWWVREAYPPYGKWRRVLWWVREVYPPYRGSGDGFYGGCAKLIHPTGEVAMGLWWVREAYPPYRGSGDGFYGGCASLTHPTKPWAHRRAGKRSAPALTPRSTPALPKTHSPWVIALNTPATATAPGSSTPSRLSLPT